MSYEHLSSAPGRVKSRSNTPQEKDANKDTADNIMLPADHAVERLYPETTEIHQMK